MTRAAGSLQLAIAIGAGLATGLAHFPDPLSVGVAIVVAAARLRRPGTTAVAGAAVLGILAGAVMQRGVARDCASRLPLGEGTLLVEAIDPGRGAGRVRPLGIACEGEVRARWPRGSVVPAGARARVAARWQPRRGFLGRPEGLLRIRRVENHTASQSWIAASRQRAADLSQALFGSRSGLVDALVAGRTGGIDFELRDRFAAAGLIHILSISGFHVGLIAFWLLLLLRSAGLASRHAELTVTVAVLGYVAWLGWPAPATRAAALFAAVTLARSRQRSVRPDALLGASALVVLAIDPWSIADLGAWLSFAAMAGLLWATWWYRTNFGPSRVGDAVAGSIGATLVTAPVVALTIGRVAAIGPLVNLVALPLAAVAVPTVMAALVAGALWPGLAGGFAAAASLLLALLDRVASIGASLPGAAGPARAGLSSALPWLVLLVVAVHATRDGSTPLEALRRAGWCGVLLLWSTLVTDRLRETTPDGLLALHFLDVGQGDAAAIRTPAGNWVLVDAGPASELHDAGRGVVLPFLARNGVSRVAVMVVSHAHRDHVGGASSVLSEIDAGAVIEPGEPFDDRWYLDWLEQVSSQEVEWLPAVAGMRWQLDGVEFRVLHPRAQGTGRARDLNEDSVVLLVRYGEFAALFTGDAGLATESQWQAAAGEVDLLKVGHHGSVGATGEELLRETSPRVAVISSGRNNYGHPSRHVLARLASAGIATWRTDLEGTVSVQSDGRRFTVSGGRTRASFEAYTQQGEAASCCIPPR